MEPAAGNFGGEVEAFATDWDSTDEGWTAAQGWRGDGMHDAPAAGGADAGHGCGRHDNGWAALEQSDF